MKLNFRQSARHYAQGLLMGGADIIPGVSGGTMALIVGIYTDLVDSISQVFGSAVQFVRGRRSEARAAWGTVHWGLIIPLGLGIATALLIGAKIIPGLLEAYPVQSRALFFGLIAGSIPIPWMRIGEKTGRMVAVAAIAGVIAFFLVGLPPAAIENPGLLRVFLSASVAICAMILPGVSGSFLLVVLGMYEATLAAVNARDFVYVGVFMLGAATGIGLFSKVLDWLLLHRHDLTMAALVGLMAGSLRALWPWQNDARDLLLPQSGEPLLAVAALAFGGFAFVILLTRFGAVRLREAEPGMS